MKKCLTMWQVWAGIAAILTVMLIFKSNSLSAILPYVALLICPLMMLFMMKDRHKH